MKSIPAPPQKLHAHFDCFSGAAGDMMLAACLDASPDPDSLLADIKRRLESISELKGEFDIEYARVLRGSGGIAACKVSVKSIYGHEAAPKPKAAVTEIVESVGGDNGHNHGHGHGHKSVDVDENHTHGHAHGHGHDSGDVDEHHTHGHGHGHDSGDVDDHHTDGHGHGHDSSDVDEHHTHGHGHEHVRDHSSDNMEHGHGHNHDDAHIQNEACEREESNRTSAVKPLLSDENVSHDKEHHNHGHKHDQEHAHDHQDAHKHDHSHSATHDNNHDHQHAHTSTNGPLRNLPQIEKLLNSAPDTSIPPSVKRTAISAFRALAHAEAKTHGSTISAVHFHEVGAIDSIVDTVGTVIALYLLNVTTVSCTKLPMGEGTVWTDHGLLPVPAPATLRLMKGMGVCPGPPGVTGELVTPTAAALLRVLVGVEDGGKFDGRCPSMTVEAVGVGAGTKDFVNHPNIMRVIIALRDYHHPAITESIEQHHPLDIETHKHDKEEEVIDIDIDKLESTSKPHQTSQNTIISSEVLSGNLWNTDYLVHVEANIDDTTAEILAYTIQKLLESGAIDAWISPIVMKKGRPAHTLHCLSHQTEHSGNNATTTTKLLDIIYRETTTLGIRIHRNVERASLHRRFLEKVQTPFCSPDSDGCVDVKLGMIGDEVVTMKAEFDQCRAVAAATGFSLRKVADAATEIAKDFVRVGIIPGRPELIGLRSKKRPNDVAAAGAVLHAGKWGAMSRGFCSVCATVARAAAVGQSGRVTHMPMVGRTAAKPIPRPRHGCTACEVNLCEACHKQWDHKAKRPKGR